MRLHKATIPSQVLIKDSDNAQLSASPHPSIHYAGSVTGPLFAAGRSCLHVPTRSNAGARPGCDPTPHKFGHLRCDLPTTTILRALIQTVNPGPTRTDEDGGESPGGGEISLRRQLRRRQPPAIPPPSRGQRIAHALHFQSARHARCVPPPVLP